MLRITMLKLKRAWSLALMLRHRGDARFPGKFQRLITVKTSQKSTKTDKENEWKCKQIIDYLFSPVRTHDEIRRIQNIIISDIIKLQKAIKKQQDDQSLHKSCMQIDSKAHYEKVKCDEIIAAIFGDAKPLGSEKVLDAKAPEEVRTVLSTTAKQTEEQLAQKIEIINETPLVEAEKPKIEGFNTPPRVLGHDLQHPLDVNEGGESTLIKVEVRNKYRKMVRRLENSDLLSKISSMTYGVVNFSGSFSTQSGKSGDTSGGDKQDEYDSITKRNLNTPNNELNKCLKREIQQLGVPKTSGSSTINIQMDTSKKNRNPSSKTEIELETIKCENKPPTDSDKYEKADSAKNIHIRTLKATPKHTFVSRLREAGIRYTEQKTPNADEKRRKKEHNLEKKPQLNSPRPILLGQNIIENDVDNVIDKQKAENVCTCIRKEQSTKHSHVQDIPVSDELCHPKTNMTNKRQPYDSFEPIIDPHDKKIMASDTKIYRHDPLRANATKQNENDLKPLTGSKKVINLPSTESYKDQPSMESYKLLKEHTINITEQSKKDEKSHTTESDKDSNQSAISNQATELGYQRNNLNRDTPYYYDQNISHSGYFPNEHNLSHQNSCLSSEPLRSKSPEDTEQNKNKEKSLSAKEDHSTLANQNFETYSESTDYQGMYLNRNMPYYYNQNITYLKQISNQQNSLLEEKNIDPSIDQKQNNVESNAADAQQTVDQSTTTNQPQVSNSKLTHQGMELNRNMSYHNNYYQNYTFPSQNSSFQNYWVVPEQSQKEKQCSKLDQNQMFVDKCTTAHAKDNKSEVNSSDSGPMQETTTTTVNSEKCDSNSLLHRHYPWMNEFPYFQCHKGPMYGQNIHTHPNPNPNETLQYTQNKSRMQDSQDPLKANSSSDQQESNENVVSKDENPDNIVLDQHTGDPSYDQVSQENFTAQMNPYQYNEQSNQSNYNMPTDSNPNVFLDQYKGDPSYDEVSKDPQDHQYPYSSDTGPRKQEQEQSSTPITADPHKIQQENIQQRFSYCPYQFHPWNQYPYYMNTMGYADGISPYFAYRHIPDIYKENQTSSLQTNVKDMESKSTGTSQTMSYPNLKPFQHPAGLVTQNPYFYQQSFTNAGNFTQGRHFFGNEQSPEKQMTQFCQHQQFPTEEQEPKVPGLDASTSIDQKTPSLATQTKPVSKDTPKPTNGLPPAGPSAAFVLLAEAKWKASTSLKPSSEESHQSDEKLQNDSSGSFKPLTEVDIPLPKNKIMPLSEILKRVRQRTRQEYLARWTQVDPTEGKCGRERPPCPPPQPVCPKAAPTPPPPCPPPPPPCPRPCKPKCPPPCTPPTPGCPPPSPPCPTPKCPCCKFVSISLADTLHNIFTLIWDFGLSIFIQRRPLDGGSFLTQSERFVARIETVNVGTQLKILENNVFTTFGSNLGKYCWKLETLILAKGFEPWVPIPSWPIPIKQKKKPLVCPKEGCKQRPPPRYGDPCERPCYPGSPCLGFPNKYRKY